MKRTTGVVMLLCAAAAPGCVSRVAKEALGAGMGAKGVFRATQEGPSLAGYSRYEVQPFTDAFAGKAPAELYGLLGGEIAASLAESKTIAEKGAGKTATLRGEVLYYEDAALSGQVFGPLEEVVARVELVDGKTVLGRAVCVGRSTTTTTQGVGNKAKGLAKAITKWIESRYPE